MTESTVKGFSKSNKNLQTKTFHSDLEFVPKKERGHPTLLTEEIDDKATEMVRTFLSTDATNYDIIAVVATGTITSNDQTPLKVHSGTLEFGIKKWCESIS